MAANLPRMPTLADVSVTRLVVLGAVRLFQPAHGYLVRRELLSWQVDEWAHVNPGSIYNALRTLTKDGLLVEEPDAEAGGQPARVRYRLTDDGETEYLRLVRLAVWQLHPFEPEWLNAGLSFWGSLTRTEVLDALAARRTQLEGRIVATGYALESLRQSPFKPESVAEHFLLQVEQLRGELAWVAAVTDRITGGAYWFDGDPGHAIPALREPPVKN
jgi:DNA-binding PadR family transcriptional regulator